jgi:sarcosine oxidase/L-pipecolate oxidase
MDAWRNDPVFKPYYHEVSSLDGCLTTKVLISAKPGRRGEFSSSRGEQLPVLKPRQQLSCASLPKNVTALRESYEHHASSSPDPVEWLDSRQEIIARAPHLANSDLRGWKGIYRPGAGWGAAMDAIDSVGEELRKFGVSMTFGR